MSNSNVFEFSMPTFFPLVFSHGNCSVVKVSYPALHGYGKGGYFFMVKYV